MANPTEKFVVLDANDPNQIILRRADLMKDVETKETVHVTFKEKDGFRTISKVDMHEPEKKGQTIKEMKKEVEPVEDDRLEVLKPTDSKKSK